MNWKHENSYVKVVINRDCEIVCVIKGISYTNDQDMHGRCGHGSTYDGDGKRVYFGVARIEVDALSKALLAHYMESRNDIEVLSKLFPDKKINEINKQGIFNE